ncbi:hypothetical protein [Methanomethylovorans sp.]|uniref:hypothetical protein n=1 Tax=Methanomethylovorans sp. TaxID=2758717 RepID=UPI00351CAB66
MVPDCKCEPGIYFVAASIATATLIAITAFINTVIAALDKEIFFSKEHLQRRSTE